MMQAMHHRRCCTGYRACAPPLALCTGVCGVDGEAEQRGGGGGVGRVLHHHRLAHRQLPRAKGVTPQAARGSRLSTSATRHAPQSMLRWAAAPRMTHARMTHARMTHARMTHARMTHARMTHARMMHAHGRRRTRTGTLRRQQLRRARTCMGMMRSMRSGGLGKARVRGRRQNKRQAGRQQQQGRAGLRGLP
jgi:hypothetical protein